MAIVLAVLFLGVLLLSPWPGWPWRFMLTAVAITLAWPPVKAILFGVGRGAVRRFEWRSDGQWVLTDGCGGIHSGVLLPGSVTLGSWLLLVWAVPGVGRLRALVDPAGAGPRDFRALKGRLNC